MLRYIASCVSQRIVYQWRLICKVNLHGVARDWEVTLHAVVCMPHYVLDPDMRYTTTHYVPTCDIFLLLKVDL